MHYNKPKFSCVALKGHENGKDCTWYAKVYGFFTFQCNLSPHDKTGTLLVLCSRNYSSQKKRHTLLFKFTEYKVAYIKYFKECGEDGDSKCKKLKWEDRLKLWGVIDIDNILKVVHMVEFFEDGNTTMEYFLMNKYLWRDTASTCEEEFD